MAGAGIGYAEIAELAGVSPATLRGYAASGHLPPADATVVPDRPRWRPETIERWLATRPGRGAPGRPRAARRPRDAEGPAPQ